MSVVVVLAIISVFIVLVIGLGSFAVSGEFNRKYGNKLMRARIVFQAVAVVLILVMIYMRSQGGQ